jgi:hypothetical protein
MILVPAIAMLPLIQMEPMELVLVRDFSAYLLANVSIFLSACPANCLGCYIEVASNTSTIRCSSCPTGQFLIQTRCVQSCPIGWYNSSATQCLPCRFGVATCTATANLTCRPGFFLNNGTCVATCPANNVVNQSTRTCERKRVLANTNLNSCSSLRGR